MRRLAKKLKKTAPTVFVEIETFEHREYDIVEFDAVPREIPLEPLIDKMLVRCAKEKAQPYRPAPRESGPRAKFVIHPSEAVGCPRAVVFSIVDAPEDPATADARIERICAMGHMGHERLQGYLFECWRRRDQLNNGITRVWEDVPIRVPFWGVEGELDAIIEFAQHYRYVVEIKTQRDQDFVHLKRPKAAWVAQARCYMKATGIKAAVILVENRNDGRIKEFFVEWDDAEWAKLEALFDGYYESILDRELPEKNTDHCFFCDYKRVCEGTKKVDWDRAFEELGFDDAA